MEPGHLSLSSIVRIIPSLSTSFLPFPFPSDGNLPHWYPLSSMRGLWNNSIIWHLWALFLRVKKHLECKDFNLSQQSLSFKATLLPQNSSLIWSWAMISLTYTLGGTWASHWNHKAVDLIGGEWQDTTTHREGKPWAFTSWKVTFLWINQNAQKDLCSRVSIQSALEQHGSELWVHWDADFVW